VSTLITENIMDERRGTNTQFLMANEAEERKGSIQRYVSGRSTCRFSTFYITMVVWL
jgi:hypothetical protein